jgi:hypothetical protein
MRAQLRDLLLERFDAPRLGRELSQEERDGPRVCPIQAALDIEQRRQQAPDRSFERHDDLRTVSPVRGGRDGREVERAMKVAGVARQPLLNAEWRHRLEM